MIKFLKTAILSTVITLLALLLTGFGKALPGSYFTNSSFNAILITIGIAVIIYAAYKGIKALWTIAIVCLFLRSRDAIIQSQINRCWFRVIVE